MDIQRETRRLLDAEDGEEDRAVEVRSEHGEEDRTVEVRSEQDTYLDKVKNGRLYLATFAAVLGPLSFGFVLGYSSPAIPELSKDSDPQIRLDDDQASWFGV